MVTVTITTAGISVNNAPYGWGWCPADEVLNRLWTDPEMPGYPVDLEIHQRLLDDDETLTVTLVTPGEGADRDAYHAASSSLILSEEGEAEFIRAFEKYAPPDYDYSIDSECSNPWCAPWFYEDHHTWYRPQLTSSQMGKRWAAMCYKELAKYLSEQEKSCEDKEEEFERMEL